MESRRRCTPEGANPLVTVTLFRAGSRHPPPWPHHREAAHALRAFPPPLVSLFPGSCLVRSCMWMSAQPPCPPVETEQVTWPEQAGQPHGAPPPFRRTSRRSPLHDDYGSQGLPASVRTCSPAPRSALVAPAHGRPPRYVTQSHRSSHRLQLQQDGIPRGLRILQERLPLEPVAVVTRRTRNPTRTPPCRPHPPVGTSSVQRSVGKALRRDSATRSHSPSHSWSERGSTYRPSSSPPPSSRSRRSPGPPPQEANRRGIDQEPVLLPGEPRQRHLRNLRDPGAPAIAVESIHHVPPPTTARRTAQGPGRPGGGGSRGAGGGSLDLRGGGMEYRGPPRYPTDGRRDRCAGAGLPCHLDPPPPGDEDHGSVVHPSGEPHAVRHGPLPPPAGAGHGPLPPGRRSGGSGAGVHGRPPPRHRDPGGVGGIGTPPRDPHRDPGGWPGALLRVGGDPFVGGVEPETTSSTWPSRTSGPGSSRTPSWSPGADGSIGSP